MPGVDSSRLCLMCLFLPLMMEINQIQENNFFYVLQALLINHWMWGGDGGRSWNP